MSVEAAASVLQRLADGAVHTTSSLAAAANAAPAELAAALALIESSGAELERFADGNIRLLPPFDWLDKLAIADGLEPAVMRATSIDLRFAASSSNDVLLADRAPASGKMPVCIVEFQHGGRGRRGRRWIAAPGGALCLSAAWTFDATPAHLSALGLAIGVAAVRALAVSCGISAGLKWPNDLVLDERKLGGILVEARADAGRTSVVAGIGINVRMAAARLEQISDWPRGAVDLASAGGMPTSRSRLAAHLLNELWRTFRAFTEGGFEPFAHAWRAAHVLEDRPAVLLGDDLELAGIVRGIDTDGALLFETGGQVRRILAGEVSLRAQSCDS
jgi:BirA family biotin operon repressor/biotin-[acetyl-CoA-carboxylase] ligase